eukprot:GHVU01064658.1.p2 GENE.GHVU01064658.1~~GHVU01064658.1.p2  ORF type:complete len:104 (+),score=4.76 GHVU01064658.1:328-639(+)
MMPYSPQAGGTVGRGCRPEPTDLTRSESTAACAGLHSPLSQASLVTPPQSSGAAAAVSMTTASSTPTTGVGLFPHYHYHRPSGQTTTVGFEERGGRQVECRRR